MKNKETTYQMFPEIEDKGKDITIFIRDELNISEYPIALLSKTTHRNKLTIFKDSTREWTLIGNPEFGGIPMGKDNDYFSALMEILSEQTQFMDNTIYFTLNYLILKAGKWPCKLEYKRAKEALKRFRGLIISSKTFKVIVDDGELKYITEDISLIQHFTFIGDIVKGRKKSHEVDSNGYCQVIFSDYFIANLRSKKMSKPLNFSFMMKLSNPLVRRLFRLIDFWKHQEEVKKNGDNIIITKYIFEVATLLPLKSTKYASLIKKHIEPAHRELKDKRYLKDWKYYKESGNKGLVKVEYRLSEYSAEQALAFEELRKRGVSEPVARTLTLQHDPAKIIDVILYSDIIKKQKKVSPGYIVKTVKVSEHESIKSFVAKEHERIDKEKRKEKNVEKEKLTMFYNQQIESIVDTELKNLSAQKRDELEREVRGKIVLYGSDKIRRMAIDGAIREVLKKNINLPSFEEWYEKNKKHF